MGDLFASGDSQATFTAVSVAGNAIYLSGNGVAKYQVSSNGSVPANGIGSTPSSNNFEREYVHVVQRSIDANVSLTGALGCAPAAVDTAIIELDLSNQVTALTASDFGRTLASNGDGSDHGWGSYHFVTGGAVKGRSFYGTAPLLGSTSPDDVGQGRMLPSMAVDQLASTLATWMGVSTSNLSTVVPGIGNYSLKDLGLFT